MSLPDLPTDEYEIQLYWPCTFIPIIRRDSKEQAEYEIKRWMEHYGCKNNPFRIEKVKKDE